MDVRSDLVYALRDDLIGPDADDPRDVAHQSETLETWPSRWYLTGFLAPSGQPLEEREDVAADDALDAGTDSDDEPQQEPVTARKPIFPSSLGLSVLVHSSTKVLSVRVRYGTYEPVPVATRAAGSTPPPSRPGSDAPDGGDPSTREGWRRTPFDGSAAIAVDCGGSFQTTLAGSGGVVVRAVVRPVRGSETQSVTVFLVNQREPVKGSEHDRGYIFQVQMEVACAEGFVPRPNPRGGTEQDELDERVGDLQYRDVYEFAVGHGVSVHAHVVGSGHEVFCERVSTTWMPGAEVEKVVASTVKGVMLGMEALGTLADAAALRAEVGAIVPAYREWIAQQPTAHLGTVSRDRLTSDLLTAAERAAVRIAKGIDTLAADPAAFDAFRIANRAMAAQAWQRKGDELRKRGEVPAWRPFQLAFLLMNVTGQVNPLDHEREIVDLIFFPTGGGKTEAYLGLAAFTLVLRRLRNPGLTSGGVSVLMRYTLRLLTLDQLDRAATLVCALEIERRKDPERLGPQRFSIGLWVGKAATPNRFGSEKKRDDSSAVYRVTKFREDPKANPSPIPLDKCPWCGEPFGQNTFHLKPDLRAPTQLHVVCTAPKCEFRWRNEWPHGIPVVAVDDELYRELPCFLIATVDKFAGLPWVGKTGTLLGRNVTHANDLGFFGPAERPPTARALPAPLLPPDLVIQDELHLISGPLGTMVGLYETVLDHLTGRVVETPGGKLGEKVVVRPKIVASTATVRRAHPQIRALFGRSHVEVFPPPGPNRDTSFFAETVPVTRANARRYVGLAAPGRSQKVLLMRTYVALLAAVQRIYASDPVAADPYMTLLGYFNSLRELGGSRRIVEDEVRSRAMRMERRHRVGGSATHFANRTIDLECVELTSRESTDKVKIAKERLGQPFRPRSKERPPVDVALASNMISVGLDILRLGLMVVCGQPKTTAEYIQATSRVGRDDKRPGLVIALLNLHKPRDRSHFEHFAPFHQSFYRAVEATSVTPFSARAIDRGLAAVAVALARLGDARLTAPDDARDIAAVRGDLGFVGDAVAARVEAHREGKDGDDPIGEVKADLRHRIDSLFDSWEHVAKDDPANEGLAYQLYEDGQASKRPLLHMPLDPELKALGPDERKFVANRSMRDVEGGTDVYVMKLKESANATESGS